MSNIKEVSIIFTFTEYINENDSGSQSDLGGAQDNECLFNLK